MKKDDEDLSNGTGLVPIEQARPAAKTKPPKFRDFKRFVADVESLRDYYDNVCSERCGKTEDNCWTADDVEADAEWCQQLSARCQMGLKQFNRPQNLEDPNDDESALSQEYVAKRIAVMVASFPNANPGSPDGYVRMLIEHVAAIEQLTEVALESACREIVETQKFAPAISEVIETINQHIGKWRGYWSAIYNAERLRLQLISVLVERERQHKEKLHQEKIQQATSRLQGIVRSRERCVKEIEQTKAAIEQANATLTKLTTAYAMVEQAESEQNRELQALLAAQNESKPVTIN
jgi:hypothetical protein